MRLPHTVRILFGFLLMEARLDTAAQSTQYDLLPTDFPTDPEYLIELARRYESIHAVSQLRTPFQEDVSIYVFGESAGCLIRLVRVRVEEDAPSAAQLRYLVEYCAITDGDDRGDGAIESIWHWTEVTPGFAHELSDTSMYLALRANSNAWFDSVPRGEQWMVLSHDLGFSGQAFRPPLDSALGRYLVVLKDLVYLLTEESVTAEAVDALKARILKIREEISPIDGKWSLEVRDLFDASLKLDLDLFGMERFRLDELNLLRPHLPP